MEITSSLKNKLLKGAFWNSISQVGSQILNFVFTIILARYLTPGDFGVVGQVGVIIGFLSFFCEFGFSPTLIQKKTIDEIDCSTAFWGLIFISSILYALGFFASPLIALFYHNDSLILISRILFLQFLLVPISIVNEILEEKKLNYQVIVQSNIISIILSVSAGITLAVMGYGVWALVVQILLSYLVKTILLIYWTEWRPKMIFSFSRFKEFFKSGLKFTYQNLNVFLNGNMDFLLVGKLAGASMLGIYSLAFRISNYPIMKMYQIIGRMLFPAFHLIKNDFEKMRDNYIKLTRFGGLILIPLIISIFFGIESFILLFLNKEWIEAAVIVKILAVYLVFLSFSFADEALMMTLNKINFINVLRTIVTLSLLLFGFFATKYFGIKGMASAFTIIWMLSILTMKAGLFKELKMTMSGYFIKMKFIFLISAIYFAILTIYTINIIHFTNSPFLYLLGEGFIFLFFMVTVLIAKGIINITERKINLSAI